jgi:cell division protein FtsL
MSKPGTTMQSRTHRRRTNLAAIGGILATVAGVVLTLLCLVWKQVQITNMSATLATLTDSIAIMDSRIAELKIYSAQLYENERIESIAEKKLGLIYPALDQIVMIKSAQPVTADCASSGQRAVLLKHPLRKNQG